MPKDPVDLDLQSFKTEIAKAIFLTFLAIRKFPQLNLVKLNRSVDISSEDRDTHLSKLALLCESTATKILNTEFSILQNSRSRIESHKISWIAVNPDGCLRIFHNEKDTLLSTTILESRVEQFLNSSMILGINFQNSLDNLSEQFPLILVPNLHTDVSRISEEQFLIASYADCIFEGEIETHEDLVIKSGDSDFLSLESNN
jgi:hypothetical protein